MMSIITPLSASMLNFTSMGTMAPVEPEVCIHSHAFQTSWTCSPRFWSASCESAMNEATEATKLRPTAASAITRTAASPSCLPQTPFTKAPRSGIARMTAMSA
jgi:hypothetical protein